MNVLKTKNYQLFSFIDGNRNVDKRRVRALKKSIEERGYIKACPIMVNEKMGIIDGQGRFIACKELNYPIYYTVVEGANLDTCRSMNFGRKNWTYVDYIKSYAESGNISYIYIYKIFCKYNFSKEILRSCVFKRDLGFYEIMEGKTNISYEDYLYADKKAKRLKLIYDACIDGTIKVTHKANLIRAMSFVYNNMGTNIYNRIEKKLLEYQDFKETSIPKVIDAIIYIDYLYNFKLSVKNRIDIVHKYKTSKTYNSFGRSNKNN